MSARCLRSFIRWSFPPILVSLLFFFSLVLQISDINLLRAREWGEASPEFCSGPDKKLYVINMKSNNTPSSRQIPERGVMVSKTREMTPTEVFIDRKNRVETFCELSNHTAGFVKNVFVHKSGVIYCHVAKAGCTFWKRMFRFAGDKLFSSYESPWNISRIAVHFSGVGYGTQYDPDIHGAEAFPTRLLVTREPFSRILSAYLDKFYLPDFWVGYSSNWLLESSVPFKFPPINEQDDYIWRHYVELKSRLGLNTMPNRYQIVNESGCAKFLTFLQFVDKVVLRYSEPHWAPSNILCDPCLFKPTHISKMETFTQDARPVLRIMELEKYMDGFDENQQVDEELRALTEYNFRLANTYERLQNCMKEDELALRLWTNFQWRGYISPEVDYVIPDPRTNIKNDFLRQLGVARQRGLEHPEKMMKAKTEFLTNAYSSLRKEHFEALCKLFETDITFFDYEGKRDEIAAIYKG